jgi:hypothetical protein
LALEKLEDDEAVVRIESIFLKYYYASGQMRNLISHDDYIAIFERIWHDRAEKTGWKLDIQYDQDQVIFEITVK